MMEFLFFILFLSTFVALLGFCVRVMSNRKQARARELAVSGKRYLIMCRRITPEYPNEIWFVMKFSIIITLQLTMWYRPFCRYQWTQRASAGYRRIPNSPNVSTWFQQCQSGCLSGYHNERIPVSSQYKRVSVFNTANLSAFKDNETPYCRALSKPIRLPLGTYTCVF